jgi:hypothetical protein
MDFPKANVCRHNFYIILIFTPKTNYHPANISKKGNVTFTSLFMKVKPQKHHTILLYDSNARMVNYKKERKI